MFVFLQKAEGQQPSVSRRSPQPLTLLDRRARELEPGFTAAFVNMVLRVRQQIPLDQLAAKIRRGAGEALAYLNLTDRMLDAAGGKGAPVREQSFREALAECFSMGAEVGLDELGRMPVRKAGEGGEAHLGISHPFGAPHQVLGGAEWPRLVTKLPSKLAMRQSPRQSEERRGFKSYGFISPRGVTYDGAELNISQHEDIARRMGFKSKLGFTMIETALAGGLVRYAEFESGNWWMTVPARRESVEVAQRYLADRRLGAEGTIEVVGIRPNGMKTVGWHSSRNPQEWVEFLEAARHVAKQDDDEEPEIPPVIPPVRRPRATMPRSVGARMAFDLRNPRAEEFLRRYGFGLIKDISRSSQEAIRQILLQAFREGGHPYETARKIRSVIGLTDNQAQAVANYMKALSGQGAELRQTLNRGLRDARYDKLVNRLADEGGILGADKIQQMTDRYAERMLNHRAEVIARTETIRASNAGVQESWQQAQEQGYLVPERTRKVWIASVGDPRTCDHCESVPSDYPDGIEMDGEFETDIGTVDAPPLHPNCRCTVGLAFA